MEDSRLSRRTFMRNTSLAAAGAVAGAWAGTDRLLAKDIEPSVKKTRSYNANMEYRPLGQTGLWLSAISLGGHWKRVAHRYGTDGFKKNRADVIKACIDRGINFVDACAGGEVLAYAEATRSCRDRIYFGCSVCEHEMRFEGWQTKEKLLEALDDIMRRAKLDYVDLWRITCYWRPSTNHTVAHEEAIVGALAQAKKAGKIRHGGISTHKFDWSIRMIEKYPEHIEALVVPYTAGSKNAHMRVDPLEEPGKHRDWRSAKEERDSKTPNVYSLIDAVKKAKVGWIGIKPFASGSIFKSRGTPDSPTKQEDDQRARLTLRYVLCNDALTCAIPGLVTVDQVHNAARAVRERRQLDLAEAKKLDRAVEEMWAQLPPGYQWLEKEWRWV